MSAQLETTYITAEEYLALERKAETKSKYYNGVIYAMSGARRKHVRVAGNISRELGNKLIDRDCDVYQSDLRVCVNPQRGLYTYPDVIVTCGEERFLDNEFDTLLNPIIVFEVLSKPTASYDRNQKFELYGAIESLKEYVLVAQDRAKIEHFARQPSGQWLMTIAQGLDATIKLDAVECELSAREVYRRVGVKEELASLKDEADTEEPTS
ncbi:MAG: Uma2 family endonuclease [Pyrinomonadaceae bacterium MAG19_C2-C3]|nr:Uma2 family endonuclease [Pyrinomonadaceae bacterium MAG19_C2-C3]